LTLYTRSTDVFALSQELSVSVIFCSTQKYIVEKYNSIAGLNSWQTLVLDITARSGMICRQ